MHCTALAAFAFLKKKLKNDILLPKLFWPTVRKKCSKDWENFWNSRLKAKNLQNLRSEQFLVTECFFNFSWKKLEQLEFKLEKYIGI
jgi:hypothetical protein